MDKQSFQAYLQLIQKLQICPKGEEPKVLQEHSDLVDMELLHVMKVVQEHGLQHGYVKEANWIEKMASKIAQALALIQPSNTQTDLLLDLQHFGLNIDSPEELRSTLDIFPKLQFIFQELSQPPSNLNIERRIQLCQEALSLISRQEQATLWAALQSELGYSLARNPYGDRKLNIEAAIDACKLSLKVINQENMPVAWAKSMMILGNTYHERIYGNREENIEKAIWAYEQSLQVMPHENMPVEWSISMMNLGNAYSNRIYGNREENIEKAIWAYEQSCKVMPRKNMPVEWAALNNQLASAYRDRAQGNRAENLEIAIYLLNESLKVRSSRRMPIEWAQSMIDLSGVLLLRVNGDQAQNIDNAINACEQSLRIINCDVMTDDWTVAMTNLANAYAQRINGDKAQNIDNTIHVYKQILQVIDVENIPIQWAQTMENLATAYAQRINGDQVQNIESAIHAYEESLKIRTQEAMPKEWAKTMLSLARFYKERACGDRARNLEAAISAFELSLQVIDPNTEADTWIAARINLATSYVQRIYGDRTQNIENAICIYKQVLEALTWEAKPDAWADIMIGLGSAYRNRIQGHERDNIEEAITTFKKALKVVNHELMPIEYATLNMNLGNAYQHSFWRKDPQRWEDAIYTYEQALNIFTREEMPGEWATLVLNLGNAYARRVNGDKSQNMEISISHYKQILERRTTLSQNTPINLPRVLNNLASTYRDRIHGSRAENIETSINLINQALQMISREAYPLQWAEFKWNLARSYEHRIHESEIQNRESVIGYFSESLEVFTPDNYPRMCNITARLLADIYASKGQWIQANSTYSNALKAAEKMYSFVLSKNSQDLELAINQALFFRAAYAAAKVGDFKAAVITIERGRARILTETFSRDRVNLEGVRQINSDLVKRYQAVADAIRLVESTERRASFDSDQPQYSAEDYRNQAIQARYAFQSCLSEIRQIPGYESFLATPTFEDIAATLQPNQPLVYLLYTPNGGLALVLTTDGITELWLNDLNDKKLLTLFENIWFKAYRQAPKNRQGWLQGIDQATQHLWDWVMAPVVNHLQQHNFLRVTLIPTGYLSFLPLHAAWTENSCSPTGRRYACEEIQFTYAPNSLSLNAARAVAEQTPANKLLAINEPLPLNAGHLPSSSFETAKAVSTFRGKGNFKILQHEAATPAAVLDALPDYSTVHFSCHGSVNFQTPLESGLLMANDEVLSLRDLLDLKLKGLRLAILSACETGIPGTELPDEVISLPTGLLQAGAAGVISSLWSVSDLSTMLLLSRFYDLWRPQNPDAVPLEPPEALHQAQLWLRDSTGPDLTPYLQNSHPELVAKLEQAKDQRPFAHPFYWAAFTYVGV